MNAERGQRRRKGYPASEEPGVYGGTICHPGYLGGPGDSEGYVVVHEARI